MGTSIVFALSWTCTCIISSTIQFSKFNYYRLNVPFQTISSPLNHFPLVLHGLLLFPEPELVHVLFPRPYNSDISTTSGQINFFMWSPHITELSHTAGTAVIIITSASTGTGIGCSCKNIIDFFYNGSNKFSHVSS